MSYGVVIEIFSGNKLLQKIKFYMADERKRIPNGPQEERFPNVDSYLSGMTNKGKF
jgi:hypothetical protein